MKCVHLTSAHDARDARILLKECMALKGAGMDVAQVAPGGEEGEHCGVKLCSVRVLHGRWKRMTSTAWQVYRAALRLKADVYHFHDPELIPAGLLLKLHGKRVVYDVHEDLPRQIYSKEWLPPLGRGAVALMARALERVAALACDAIVVATPAIARRFPPKKTVLVQNYPRREEYQCLDAPRDFTRSRRLIYVGQIAQIRGIKEMVRAMSFLPPSSDARLALVGAFESVALAEEVRGLPGFERVDCLGERSREEVRALMSECCAGLVLFLPEPNHLEAQPTKLYEYMAAGLPVIASNFPHWRSIVEEPGCGLVADPCDPPAIAAVIQRLLEAPEEAAAMGSRGRELARTRYSWEAEAVKLVELYRRLSK
jgi:glycosyltransferase involved in cell wall biosynthesis